MRCAGMRQMLSRYGAVVVVVWGSCESWSVAHDSCPWRRCGLRIVDSPPLAQKTKTCQGWGTQRFWRCVKKPVEVRSFPGAQMPGTRGTQSLVVREAGAKKRRRGVLPPCRQWSTFDRLLPEACWGECLVVLPESVAWEPDWPVPNSGITAGADSNQEQGAARAAVPGPRAAEVCRSARRAVAATCAAVAHSGRPYSCGRASVPCDCACL
jgi:hypothetical protein